VEINSFPNIEIRKTASRSFAGAIKRCSRKLRPIYPLYDQMTDEAAFGWRPTTENAGFTDFLDCDDSSADFNFRERSNSANLRPNSNLKESSDMKRTIFVLFTVAALAMTTGCLRRHCRENACPNGNCSTAEACPSEGGGHLCRLCDGHGCKHCLGNRVASDPGPASGAVAYPYYNLRGPRDFLERNPQSIGP
jgi:hypothetical protein